MNKINNNRFLFRGKMFGRNEWRIGFVQKPCNEQVIIDGVFVEPETIGQCTGLHDKNNKLIFEGDIVVAPRYDAAYFPMKYHKFVVEWMGYEYGLVPFDIDKSTIYYPKSMFSHNNIEFIEIVDNIHGI